MQNNNFTLLITGDFVVTDSFRGNDLVDSQVLDFFGKADYRILNLEAPVTPDEPQQKIIKTGPNIRVSENVIIPVLKEFNTDLVSIANNHILDYGVVGLQNTFTTLKKHNIEYVGAGNSFNEAKNYVTIEKSGLKIAILNFCESEWSTTTTSLPGANPLDTIENAKKIIEAKKTHDKVICIIHGGHQLYNYPSPRMQKQYRYFIDQGADAIIGHHPHCIGGYESYNNSPIYYSLGNFLFTLPYKLEGFHEGIIAELKIDKDSPIDIKPHFVKQDINSHFLTFSTGEDLDVITKKFNAITKDIGDEQKIQEHWDRFVINKSNTYLSSLSANKLSTNKYFQGALNKLKIKLINQNTAKILLNHMRCEAHSELSIEILNRYLKK